MRKKVNIQHWLIVLFFCIITGYSIAAVYVTDGNAASFYDIGDRMAFDAEEIFFGGENLAYEREAKRFTVTKERAGIVLHSYAKENDWQYLTIGLSDLNKEEILADFSYYDDAEECVGTDRFVLKEGERQLHLSAPAFSSVRIVFRNQKGTGFSIDTLCFSTKYQTKRAGEIGKYGALFTLLCIPLAVWFYFFCRVQEHPIDGYALIDLLQGFYIVLGRRILRGRKRVCSKAAGKYLRIAVITVLMIVIESVNVSGTYFNPVSHRCLMLFFTACIMMLAALSLEGELERKNWKNPFVLAWCAFWGMSCVSDFLVKKSGNYFGFYGYFMLVVFGFLFFVWGNRKEKHTILWEICKAVEWTFLLSILFCLLCRPENAGFRYNGFCNNPNPFGFYLAIAGGVFLCELEYYWRVKGAGFIRQFLYGAGYLADVFFLWKTQCTTAVIALLGITVIWILCNIRDACSVKRGKRFLATIALLCIFFRPVTGALQWGILNIPDHLNTTIVYPKEGAYAEKEEYLRLPGLTETVYAAEIGSSRIWKKLTTSTSLNSLLSGRLTCYAAYLRSMNLFGHERIKIVYGISANYAHNGFLAYMHLYGAYIFIPYFIINLYGFYYAAVYWRRGRAGNALAFLPFAVFFIFFLENMADTVETPFHFFVWFVFVFVEGVLFHMTDGENEHGKNII